MSKAKKVRDIFLQNKTYYQYKTFTKANYGIETAFYVFFFL